MLLSMKLQSTHKGFSAVISVVVLVLIGSVVVIGNYVYQVRRTATASLEKGDDTNETKTDKISTTDASPTPAPAQPASAPVKGNADGYLTIKEWGIKLKLADAESVAYVMHGTPGVVSESDTQTSHATFGLADSITLPEACRNLGMTLTQSTTSIDGVKIGGLYYGFAGVPTTTCIQDQTYDSLRNKISSLELINRAIEQL